MSRTADPESPPMLEPGPVNGHADYDALAELFLGEDRPPRRAMSPAPTQPIAPSLTPPRTEPSPSNRPIEALILGHLPVLASAWVQQYARHIAGERKGPVGLLRLRAGEAQLDVIGGAHETGRLFASLSEAIDAAAEEVAAWIIRVDETTEPRLPELRGLACVTLLTGADEAAVVSAYRTLKNLIKPAEDADGPDLRITIMGSAPDKAAEASAKLERAAAAFIGRPIRIAHCIARIGGRASAVLFRGPWAGTVDETVRMVSAARGTRPPQAVAPRPLEGIAGPKPEAKAHDPVVSRLGHLHHGPSTITGPLAGKVAGLRCLEIACPYATGVEFALDERGTMHVLGRLETTDLAGLLTAAAWVRSHQALLRLALAAQAPGFDGAEPSVLHLFTDDARRVRALGDSPVRLHLLARVETTGGAAWFCSPLN